MDILRKVIKNLTYDNILVNVDAKNRIEAVKLSGEILYRTGKVSKEYIEGMIKTTKRLGPYVVIVPGVALPHARPEDGALDIGLSIVVLQNPIDFDSPNDPVKVIIGISAPTNSEHIKLLRELALILSDGKFLRKLKHAKTPGSIIDAFKYAVENCGVKL
jgi:mannitol/fructose-specific phosphotransferase system IIA component (Ntr-type)